MGKRMNVEKQRVNKILNQVPTVGRARNSFLYQFFFLRSAHDCRTFLFFFDHTRKKFQIISHQFEREIEQKKRK